MEINLKKLGEQEIATTTGNETKMRLSEDAQSMVFQLFTKNVYSNPIGTIVREITSNCFDSHIEAGVDFPVKIKKSFDNESSTHYISFIDYGVGMSPDRVKNVYGVYFESTKRTTNEQIGGFGIGGKTPLAYKRSTGFGEGEYDNSFYVITIFDNTKYYYCIYEGEESPIISLLHHEKTTERNGTEIRIPVLEKDIPKFVSEMKRQLYYFENIIFEGFEDYNYGDELNDYKIFRGKTFWYRGTDYSHSIHVCLGRVAYPIDYNVLELIESDHRIPVAIKLEVGDINVTVSRESLDYSEKTIKLLKKKIKEVKEEIIKMLSKQYENITTLEEYFQMKNEFGKLNLTNDVSINLGNIIPQKDVEYPNFKYSFLKLPSDKVLFNILFNGKKYGKIKKKRYIDNSTTYNSGYQGIVNNNNEKNLYYVEGEFKRKMIKQSYLKYYHKSYFIITKKNIHNKYVFNVIADTLKIAPETFNVKEGEEHPLLQTFLDLQEEYMDIIREHCTDYDTFEVPEDFKVNHFSRGRGLTKEMLKTHIPVVIHPTGHKEKISIKTLLNFSNYIFYGEHDESNDVNKHAFLLRSLFIENNVDVVSRINWDGSFVGYKDETENDAKNLILFITMSKANIKKYVKYFKNARHYTESLDLIKRKKSIVEKIFLGEKFMDKYEEMPHFYKRENLLSMLNSNWYKKLLKIKKRREEYLIVKKTPLTNYKEELLAIFGMEDNFKLPKEDKEVFDLIDKFVKLHEKNKEALKWIELPYGDEPSNYDQSLIDNVLKKILVFTR